MRMIELLNTAFASKYLQKESSDYLISFLLGFSLRILPEILSWPWLLGIDTPNYIFRLRNLVYYGKISKNFLLDEFMFLLSPLTLIADPWYVIKLSFPVVHGLTTLSIYHLANTLKLDRSQRLTAVLVYAFNPIALLLTWALRNNLAIFFLLLMLAELSKEEISPYKLFAFFTLSTIHETALGLSTVLMYIMLFRSVIKSDSSKELRKIFLCLSILGTIIIFLYFIYVISGSRVEKLVMWSSLAGGYSKSIAINKDLSIPNWVIYLQIAHERMLTVLLSYILVLPAAVLGRQRNRPVKYIEILLLAIAILWIIPEALVKDLFPWVPNFLLLITSWIRWTFLLIIPLSLRAADGLRRFGRLSRPYLALLLIIGLLFSVVPTRAEGSPTEQSYISKIVSDATRSLTGILKGRKITTLFYSRLPIDLQPYYAEAMNYLSSQGYDRIFVPRYAYAFTKLFISPDVKLRGYNLSSLYKLLNKVSKEAYVLAEEPLISILSAGNCSDRFSYKLVRTFGNLEIYRVSPETYP